MIGGQNEDLIKMKVTRIHERLRVTFGDGIKKESILKANHPCRIIF